MNSKIGKKIVFMGTPEFAVSALNALLARNIEVAAVVTAPDRPAGRGLDLRMSAVKQRAMECGIPVLQPEKLKAPEFIEALQAINADLFVVVAFRMLPEVVWSLPTSGTINLHASLLPDYRGAAPINWAVINGERRTGLTTFFIRHEIDTGDIIDQKEVPIGPEETAGELHDRMMMIGGELLADSVIDVLSGNVRRRPQHSIPVEELHHAPKLNTGTCRIDHALSAARIHDHIRGLSPYPGAWTLLRMADKAAVQCKVYRSRRTGRKSDEPPGTIVRDKDHMYLCTGDELLEILELQVQGKKRMASDAFLRGVQQDVSMSVE